MRTQDKIDDIGLYLADGGRRRYWRDLGILDHIGNTPIVHLKNINTKKNVHFVAKLENFNPGGSVKDRAALSMIENAEASGELTRDKIVIEATSGNTGIGLALICAAKGYRLVLAMPESASQERKMILKNYGAQLILTPSSLGTDGAIEYIYDLYNQYPDRYFMVDQFNSEMNPLAHYNTTAPEIWAQTDHEVTAVVCTLGTTGTVMGIGRRMKELNPDIKIIAIEPNQNHKIQGLKNMTESYVPGIFDRSLPDRIINVSDEECFSMLKRLTVEEGLFVGMSSGAAAAGALKYIDEIDEGVVVVIFPDGGERYLSTHIYNNCREVQHTPDAGAEKQAAKKLEDIYLFNTMTRQKEKMLPLEEGKIKLYTCGPTVDRLIDLHQMRRYVITDILIRYLEYKNYSVTHVVNVTDIDDRTILASQNSNTPLADLTSQYMDEFLSDMDSLKITRASTYCRYSDNIEDMIALTKKLYAKGLAYEKHRSIYFDVSRYRKYGVFLNGLDHEQKAKLENDAESHESDHAEDPMDFTLFKRATLNELKKGLHFKSEWGSGRPSWHVACAALAMKYLGDQYDIHTSASMHMYPHNENTIATACALGKKNLANYWLHTAPVAVDHATMSWKNGNVTTVRELLERKYPVRHLRCFFLNANYREHLNYSEEILKHTSGKMERLDAFLQKVLDYTPGEQGKDNHFIVKKWVETFEASLNNDLDVVSALQSVFDLADEATPLIENGWLSIKDHDALFSALRRMDSVLMVMNLPSEK